MTLTKTAAILIIGDEILSGRTQDANTQFIAKALGDKGIAVMETRTIPDVIETIVDAVSTLRAKMDYVFTTGGIGPTHDDRTAEAMAKTFGVALERNQSAWDMLVAHYGGAEHMNAGRARMTMIPKGAALIANPVSIAPGFQLKNVYVMAGVPKIMQAMLEGVLPTLEGGAVIHSRSVMAELPESTLMEGLEAIEQSHNGISVGSYPRWQPGALPSTVIVIRGVDLKHVEEATQKVAKLMKEKGANAVFQ